ncbi:MAG: pyridoxal-phosphate dependent enzyme [Halobacteriaceae archaeon]
MDRTHGPGDAAPGPTDGVPGLWCPACERSFDASAAEAYRCVCGRPFELDAVPRPPDAPPDPVAVDDRAGLWAHDRFLPPGPACSLGEGNTPEVDAPDWGATFKREGQNPTGSFKDRGAATTVARAVALGVDRVVEDSSGNAGLAIASYAARAGIDARVYVPADAPAAKRRPIEQTGAEVVPVEGDRAAVADAAVAAVDDGEGWYASHAWQPAFPAGTATVAVEVARARDWAAPDAFVCPAGHGTLLLGAYRGFTALRRAGWIDERPSLLVAQAAGHAPLVAALGGDPGGENAVADGVQIDRPVRRADLLDAVESTGGDAVAVDAAQTRATHAALGRAGFDVEPTAALGPAALAAFRDRGAVGPDDDVVVALTGRGKG